VAPPLPWASREAALRRNQEMQRVWERKHEPSASGPLRQQGA